MTNAGVTGNQAEEIKRRLKSVGVAHVKIFGSTWINQQIHENKRLRMLVPRVYGLGDLSQILDERAYTQARYILESMREDLAKVVVTDAYRQSAEAINKHSFVLLIGEPASGKTTIASLLSMAAIDQWNASILKLDDPRDVVKRWNPNEPSQFFWLDDVFGDTQYDDSLVRHWNRALPRINPMLHYGAKIVMTSRDYIYNRALDALKHSTFPLLNESQVVIDVHGLSDQEKRQILYNHIKLGDQERSFRTKIKPHLDQIATHPRFIPEIARRLGNKFFTKQLPINRISVEDFVEKREQLLQETIQGLDADCRAALALIYMRNGHLESPLELRASESDAVKRLGSHIGGCISALNAMRGSLVRLSPVSHNPTWQFSHPTIGDAYAATLGQNPELIDIFIRGSEPERLIREVTCGDVGIKNAIVVPFSSFPQVVEKIKYLKQSNLYERSTYAGFEVKELVQSFLAIRCSREFIGLYLMEDPGILEQVAQPRLYLQAVTEVDLAKRLFEFGLLPDEERTMFIEKVSDYALQGEDASALIDKEIRSMFADTEYDQLIEKLRLELLPQLEDVRVDWEHNYYSNESPDDHMLPFLRFLTALSEEFNEDQNAVEIINNEIWAINEWIEEHQIDSPEEDPWELDSIESTTQPETTRSIFDDIDAEE